MTIRKIVYTTPTGGVAVVHPARQTHPVPENLTDEQTEQRAWNALPADAINPKLVDPASLPSRATRKNWTRDANGDVVVDTNGAAKESLKSQLAAIDSTLNAQRWSREGILGLGTLVDLLRSCPENITTVAELVAWLRAIPAPGSGMTKLRQIEEVTAKGLRDQLAALP